MITHNATKAIASMLVSVNEYEETKETMNKVWAMNADMTKNRLEAFMNHGFNREEAMRLLITAITFSNR